MTTQLMAADNHEIKFYQSGQPFCICGAHGERVYQRSGQWVCEEAENDVLYLMHNGMSEAEALETLEAEQAPDYLTQAYTLACQNSKLDPKRLARALALAQQATRDNFGVGYLVPCSPDTDASGRVLITARPGYIGPCHCADRMREGKLVRAWCKHRLCAALLEKATDLKGNAEWVAALPDVQPKRTEVNLMLYGEA